MKRFELSTLSLARRCSTTELHPQNAFRFRPPDRHHCRPTYYAPRGCPKPIPCRSRSFFVLCLPSHLQVRPSHDPPCRFRAPLGVGRVVSVPPRLRLASSPPGAKPMLSRRRGSTANQGQSFANVCSTWRLQCPPIGAPSSTMEDCKHQRQTASFRLCPRTLGGVRALCGHRESLRGGAWVVVPR
jgi:hypothetical protein